jgi:glycosyltransferase involved in cell wall biosynthesis
MSTHPVGCFGYGLQKILGKVKYAFWPWDWFPPVRVHLKIYAAVVKHYIRRVDFPFALTEGISKEVGKNVPVVMLGMKRLQCADVDRTGSKRILVVGQLRRGQGIEDALEFIAAKPQYSLTLLGAAANGFESEIYSIISRTGISDRVDFPNRFVSQDELSEAASKCFCGLALYDTSGDNFTHYADPGKVKSYLEMGLPVVMTRISGIVPYIEKYKAGEVIDSLTELSFAVDRINENPDTYLTGVRLFSEYFRYDKYYADKLSITVK